MALVTVTSGNPAKASDVQQVINLLTGVMTDQAVYIANTIRASTTGATTFAAFAGGTAGGAPTTGTHGAGEFIVDTVNKIMYICTVAGTPGTWATLGVQTDSVAGDYLSLVAAGAAAVAGAVGKAADAGHQHPAFVNAASGFTGNLFQGQVAGVNKITVDQAGNLVLAGTLTATTIAGTLSTAAQPNITSLGTIASLVASALNLAANTGNTVPTLGSANGAKIWIQATDPGVSAANGDLWFQG